MAVAICCDLDCATQAHGHNMCVLGWCRMWPPVTPALGLQREATADTSIGSHKVSKGERIWIDVEGIHHDSRFWPQPEVRLQK